MGDIAFWSSMPRRKYEKLYHCKNVILWPKNCLVFLSFRAFDILKWSRRQIRPPSILIIFSWTDPNFCFIHDIFVASSNIVNRQTLKSSQSRLRNKKKQTGCSRYSPLQRKLSQHSCMHYSSPLTIRYCYSFGNIHICMLYAHL